MQQPNAPRGSMPRSELRTFQSRRAANKTGKHVAKENDNSVGTTQETMQDALVFWIGCRGPMRSLLPVLLCRSPYGASPCGRHSSAGGLEVPNEETELLQSEKTANDTIISRTIAWARQQGVVVVLVEQLSFHYLTNAWHSHGPSHRIGPYLRLDIPKLIQKHRLMDLPGICDDPYVLYTDSDVLFVNPITHDDMEELKAMIAPTTESYLLYGTEAFMTETKPENTGVMLLDVDRFHHELPAFHQYGKEHGPFVPFDQGWVNSFYEQPQK